MSPVASPSAVALVPIEVHLGHWGVGVLTAQVCLGAVAPALGEATQVGCRIQTLLGLRGFLTVFLFALKLGSSHCWQ